MYTQITVSTVGLVPEIREFVKNSKARLAVSLHATTDEVRNWIVPVNVRHNLAELITTLEELFPAHGPEFVLIECDYLPLCIGTCHAPRCNVRSFVPL